MTSSAKSCPREVERLGGRSFCLDPCPQPPGTATCQPPCVHPEGSEQANILPIFPHLLALQAELSTEEAEPRAGQGGGPQNIGQPQLLSCMGKIVAHQQAATYTPSQDVSGVQCIPRKGHSGLALLSLEPHAPPYAGS